MDVTTLKIITDDTLKAIRKYDIVTPELFKDTFLTQANEREVVLDMEDLAEHTIEATLHKVFSIEEQTKENTQILQENIDLATVAIEEKDAKLLDIVQVQMKELNKRISQLEDQVYLDELTKAYNRKWLFEKFLIDHKFTRSGTIVFIDVDKFKIINDTYGHITGDKVLAMIANLSKSLDNADIVRYGGDEFIVISSDSNIEKYQQKIDYLSANLSKKLFKYQGNTFQVHISYGVLEYKAGDNFQNIIDEVDQKMYRHKKEKV